jgi:hypothetical protein
MKDIINTLFLLLIVGSFACAQNFRDQTDEYRDKYKKEFLHTSNSPLKEGDLPFLQFFDPDSTYRVIAKFEKSKN